MLMQIEYLASGAERRAAELLHAGLIINSPRMNIKQSRVSFVYAWIRWNPT